MSKNYREIITSLLLVHLLNIAVSQNPPIQNGDIQQYFLFRVNTVINLTCPFSEVDFYKWNKLNSPSQSLAESKNYQLKISVNQNVKSEVYECEAVNGYGKRNARFVAKAIDVNSKQFDIDCKSVENGPCFLVSSIDNNFIYEVDEGDKIALDCRAILNSTGNKNALTYSWRRIPMTDSYRIKQSIPNNEYKRQFQMLESVPPIEKIESSNFNDMSQWSSMVLFDKVTKEMDGVFMCSASNSINTINRTFRLVVREAKANSSIEGPLVQNISIALGSTHSLSCKASNSLSKPKWGKKLEKNEVVPDPSSTIMWEGNQYRMLQGSLDLEHVNNEGTLNNNNNNNNNANFYVNNLKLENIGKADTGTYICSVLVRSNSPETKFVYLTLKSGGDVKENNNFPLYIIGPIAVFVICFGTVLYCLIRRKLRQESSFKNRAGRGTTITTTNTSSANGSSSGSRNASNPRQHMLPTSTVSSKSYQPQYVPANEYPTNSVGGPPFNSNYPAFAAGYTPAVMNYNYTGHGQYMPQSNTTPSSTEIDHPCSHHACLSHNPNVPYDSDTTPSPPPPTSVTDTVSTVANNPGNPNIPPYSISGVSINSYSPNQSSQVYSSHQPSQVSSNNSSSMSTSNAPYMIHSNQLSTQQTVYPVGNMYSA